MQRLFNLLFDIMFGCWHRDTSRVFHDQRRKPYVVCLTCGKEFPYDWQQMKVLPQAVPSQAVTAVPPQLNPLQARFLTEASPRFR